MKRDPRIVRKKTGDHVTPRDAMSIAKRVLDGALDVTTLLNTGRHTRPTYAYSKTRVLSD
jgi:hypothetical protein